MEPVPAARTPRGEVWTRVGALAVPALLELCRGVSTGDEVVARARHDVRFGAQTPRSVLGALLELARAGFIVPAGPRGDR
jgi:hypothetical protein